MEDMLNDSVAYSSLHQIANTHNLFINQSFNYQKKLGDIIVSAISGINFLHNTFSSTLKVIDSSYQIKNLGVNFQNDIQFNQLNAYTKLEATYKINDWQLRAQLTPTYQRIGFNLKPVESTKENEDYFMLAPSISVDKKWGLHSAVHASYLSNTTSGLIKDIFPGNIVSDYRSILANNATLPRVKQNKYSLRYTYKKPLKLFFYNLFSSYTQTNSNTINSFIIDSGVTKQISMKFHNESPLFSVGGGISKDLFFVATKISGKFIYSRQSGYNYNNEQINRFHLSNYTANIMAAKKLLQSGILSISLNENFYKNWLFTSAKSAKKASNFWNQHLVLKWEHNICENVQYQIVYTDYSAKQNSKAVSSSQFLDLSIQYNPFKWKGYFELKCINLLNEKTYEELNIRTNGFSLLQMPLRERRVLLKYTFNF